ncbi:ABC transporter ATP-binding protein [Flavobacteriaceae bacterium]|jgi:ABC-2 type transport system ATP-binding protein|nr:ABC transporter ATP-binding protein [Flavobacteriaceae bacterium]
MISLKNISKKYSKQTILDITALDIPEGQTFGLVGNNGAGKTTLFSCLLDLIKPTTGRVINNGVDVMESEGWKSFTAAFLDDTFLIGYLMPEEYFYFIGELRGLKKKEVDEFVNQFEDFFHGEILGGKKYLRDLSKGNQKKAGVVAALLGEPKVVILDEPFANLDPSTQIRLKQILKDLSKNKKTTILVSSHDIQDVTEVCERIVLLEKGKIIKDINTSPETLKELEAYFKA